MDATTGPIRDGAFTMADDKKISFRFYVPKETDVKIVPWHDAHISIANTSDTGDWLQVVISSY